MSDVACIEVAQVQRGEGLADIEHSLHIGDVARVPTAYVQGREGAAAAEHVVHIGDAFDLCNWNTPVATSIGAYCVTSAVLPPPLCR